MPFLRWDDIPWVELAPGVRARRLVDGGRGSGAVTMGELEIDPDSPPRLRHWHSVEEVVVVREGSGLFSLADVAREVTVGDVILVPAGLLHGIRNVGSTVMRTFFTYPAVNVERHEVVDSVDAFEMGRRA